MTGDVVISGPPNGPVATGPQAIHMEDWDYVKVYCPVCNHLERMPWEGPLPMLAAVDPGVPDAPAIVQVNWRPLLPFVERFRKVLADRCTNLTDPLGPS